MPDVRSRKDPPISLLLLEGRARAVHTVYKDSIVVSPSSS